MIYRLASWLHSVGDPFIQAKQQETREVCDQLGVLGSLFDLLLANLLKMAFIFTTTLLRYLTLHPP